MAATRLPVGGHVEAKGRQHPDSHGLKRRVVGNQWKHADDVAISADRVGK